MNTVEPFNNFSDELKKGVNLIEASAGTGKTYAITMLALRFVVEKEIPLEQLLVVTFTNAATRELRGRIRQRLAEARDIVELSQQQREASNRFDLTLKNWAKNWQQNEQRRKALLLLEKALHTIDEAPVFTIHGFCQRMLIEQALESNQLFDMELLTDTSQQLLEIAEDYWRNLFYPLNPQIVTLLLSDPCFVSPAALLNSVKSASGAVKTILPQCESAEKSGQKLVRELDSLRGWLLNGGEAFFCKIQDAGERGLFKDKLAKNWQNWLAALREWCVDSNAPFFGNIEWLSETGIFDSLNGKRIRGAEKKAAFVADWSFPPEIEQLSQQMDRFFLACRVEFARLLQKERRRRLASRGEMGFDDLIGNLAAALTRAQGADLKKNLARRFKAALIDEFQDTDRNQYDIFSLIFADSDHYLYLIGDPKQAIYSFRGADIHSFFTAREKADRLLTLGKNYRSHPLLVGEINRLFTNHRKPFFYRREKLAFESVSARKSEECDGLLDADGNSANGMVYWLLPQSDKPNGRWGAADARVMLLGHVVAEIGKLLDGKRQWHIDQGGISRPLAAMDIAVLVRNNNTAEKYSNALADAGIPAVVTSKSSVFDSPECAEMLLLLRAVLVPSDPARIKAARAISWFGCDGQQLYQETGDEALFTQWQLQLAGYGDLWQQDGFFVMMARLLREENVMVRLAREMRGERRIANIRQLCGLIQQEAEQRRLSPRELYRWLLQQHKGERTISESELLLESDQQAVQIVTMHSAKGLEYGVVFCVDLWGGIDRLKSEKYQLLCCTEEDVFVDLGSRDFEMHRQQVQKEQRAEELRLFYVAVTRAKMRCYLPWVDVQGHGVAVDSFLSPLGYLLFSEENSNGCDYQQQLTTLLARTREDGVKLERLEDSPLYTGQPFRQKGKALQRRNRRRTEVGSSWQLSSFSSLSGLSEYQYEQSLPAGEGECIAVSGLPSGPRFGNVVHDLLEHCSFSDLAEKKEEDAVRCLECARRHGVRLEVERLMQLLQLAVTTPLQPQKGESFSLAQLADVDCLKEMPFCFAHDSVDTDQISNLLSAEEEAVIALGRKEIAGYLTGFIDLVCKWRGRYYLLDYKTNNLGNVLKNYQNKQLLAAMRSHNYGLQYSIYTLALHRYLGSMLEEYDYERHFGGVFYLFVRGMTPIVPGNGIFAARPSAGLVKALDKALGKRDTYV